MGYFDNPRMSSQSVVIGLDFGTTYSGIAWALDDGEKKVEVVSTWPGGGNRTSPKVPTTISYDNNKFLWGFQATSQMEVIRGIKLLLDESQSTSYRPSLAAKKMLEHLGKLPGDVAADYLEKVVSHAKSIIKRRFGAAAADMDLEFALTAPAVWTDKAKDITLKAAVQAGIPGNKLTLLSEPESAALYTLRTIQPNTIREDDVLVVCDAGGGTVDLISYVVENVSPLSLQEVVEGSGGMCGSMVLDQHFEQFFEDLLGPKQYKRVAQKARYNANRYWRETIKPGFVGGGGEGDEFEEVDWAIPVPGTEDDPSIELEGGMIMINKSQIQGIFDPVVQDVIRLVNGQIKSVEACELSVKAILLVGGFGGSEYLYRRLAQANPNIHVMQPPNAWEAVVHGAVLRGLDGNQVKSRVARFHYGVTCHRNFIPGLHYESEKYWCDYEECWKARDQMSWFIHKGASISENNPIHHRFYRMWDCNNRHSIIFDDVLSFSVSEVAPMTKSKGVEKLCELTAYLNDIPRDLFEKKVNSKGVEYYKICFDLVLIPTSAYIYFQLEFNGTSYGSVQAQY